MIRQHAKVIVNPAAGAYSTHRKWPRIKQLLTHIGFSFEYQHTEGIGHAIELAQEAANDGFDFLVAVGGDGTVNEVANGIVNSSGSDRTRLGVVNTGTGSDFVRSLHIPRDYVRACPFLHSQQRLSIDVGFVEYYKDGKPNKRFFLNAAGVGFDAEVAEERLKLPRFFPGTLPYVYGLLKKLLGYRNKTVHLGVDGREEKQRILSVVVANGCYFGGGMNIAPQAELGDGLLDVLTVGDFGKLELLKAFPTIYKGTHVNHPKVRMEKATRIKVSSDERLLVHADGEILGEGPVSFGIIPSALSVVV